MHSCIYEGVVGHRRSGPKTHRFSYSLFLMYLDLDELERVFRGRWLWSASRLAPARFDRRNHLEGGTACLKESVCDLVQSRTGRRPSGPVRILTNLKYFGYCFNPLSLYYCFDELGRDIDTIVAEVDNTPWGERHIYVLEPGLNGIGRQGRWQSFATDKEFHVSPFLEMGLRYTWRLSDPGERINANISVSRGSERVLETRLGMVRKEISGPALRRILVRYPFMTAQVVGAIYLQAFRLWAKRVPFHAHPREEQRLLELSKNG